MLLGIFKSNRPVTLILFPIIGLLFWLSSFIKPEIYPFYLEENGNALFPAIYNLFEKSAFAQSFIAFCLVILAGFLIQFINNHYLLQGFRTVLPAPLFVIIICGINGMHTLHPVYFGSLFLLVAIYRLLGIFEESKSYSASFDAGLMLGIGSLFYFELILFFPAFLIGIAILSHEFKWRRFVIHFLGILLPFIFLLAYGFLTERIPELLKTLELNILTPNNHFRTNIPLHIYLSFLILLTILGSLRFIQQYDKKKVGTRKYFTIFFLIFLFSLLGFMFIPAVSQEMLILMAIPVSYLVSNYLFFMKSKFWGEIIFMSLIGIVIYMQIAALK